jgi:hypothetical protein
VIWFVLGFLAGSGAVLLFLGYLAVVAEDEELQEAAKRKREKDRKNLRDIEDWYRSYY